MLPAHDFRFALRTSMKSPGFTIVVVLILGIGIGANTAMFTLVNDLLLKPLPSPEGHRIMHVGTDNLPNGIASAGVSYPDFVDWRSQSRSFSGLALFEFATFNVSDSVTAAEPVPAARLTANAFRTLRVTPLRGRDFQPGDDQPGAPPVVILGYGTWMRRYGGDPGVIGRTIRVNGTPASVVGVMPEGMQFPATADAWMPLIQTAEHRRRESRTFEAFGRLRDGASLEEARTEMKLLGRQLAVEYPDSNKGVRPVVNPYTERGVGGQMRIVVVALQAAVGFLLLIVCANAANLLLSRSVSRAREIAIRAALGAGRAALVRQLLIESVAYAAMGGVLGLAMAYWGVRAFDLSVSNAGKPYWLTFEMDYRVFGFLALVVMLTGIAFGLAPALQLLRAGVSERLKEGARGNGGGKSAHRLASAFVVMQLALTTILLVGIGLLARAIVNTHNQAKGFDAAPVLTMRLRLPAERYPGAEDRGRFQETLLARLRQMPEVGSAAVTSHLPLFGSRMRPVEPEGHPPGGKIAEVSALTVSPDYFRAFGIRLVAGRQFTDADGGPGHANVIVNQRFAAKYWRAEDPLGKRLRLAQKDGSEWFTVTGVSADVRQNQASRELAPVVYVPGRGAPEPAFFVVLRTTVAPENLSGAVRKEIHAIDPDLPVSSVMTMEQVLRLARLPQRVFGSMFVVFGLIAAALAGLGVYSVTAYSVAMRTQEIGLRMALGATRRGICGMVVSRGLWQVAVGLTIGLAGALVVTRGLRSLLIEVSATDPATFIGMAAFVTALALAACLLPARRAANTDPLRALRHQ